MNIPWFGSPPYDSKYYKYAIYLILSTLIIISILNIIWVFSNRPKLLYFSLIYIYPIILLSLISYRFLRSQNEKRRAKQYSEIINRSSYYLNLIEPDIDEFDKILSTEIQTIKKGPVSLFLYTLIIFLDFCRTIIIVEHDIYQRHNNNGNLSGLSKEFPYKKLFIIFKKMQYKIKNIDEVGTFDLIGNLLATIIQVRQIDQEDHLVPIDSNNLIEKCESISDLIKIRLFNEIDDETINLISLIRLQKIISEEDISSIGWQALIGFWIQLRIGLIKKELPKELSKVWVGPCQLLANQIDGAMFYYKKKYYRNMVKLIISSFDWRLKIPGFLYNPESISRT